MKYLTVLLGLLTTSALALPNSYDFEKRDPFAEASPEMADLAERHFTGDPNVSGPFALLTSSKYKKYDKLPIIGTYLGVADNLAIPISGAPIPPSESSYYTYYLDTTFGSGPPPSDPSTDPQYHPSGTLVYPIYPQYPTAVTGSLSYNSSSNVAAMLLSAGPPIHLFEFQKKTGYLGIDGVFDRWHICEAISTAYGPKRGIAWQMGRGEIDTGSGACKRVWIKKTPFPKK